MMELETINKLYLELSQFATAKTQKQIELEGCLGLLQIKVGLFRQERKETVNRIRDIARRTGVAATTDRVRDELEKLADLLDIHGAESGGA